MFTQSLTVPTSSTRIVLSVKTTTVLANRERVDCFTLHMNSCKLPEVFSKINRMPGPRGDNDRFAQEMITEFSKLSTCRTHRSARIAAQETKLSK